MERLVSFGTAWIVAGCLALAGNLVFADKDTPAAGPAGGQEAAKPAEKNNKPDKEEAPRKRQAEVTLGGKRVPYAVQTGTMPLRKDDGTTRASVFYVYYAVEDGAGVRLCDKDPARPIMFCFNGGPGASAVWLHLGGLGPRRVNLSPEGLSPSQVGRVVDNPHSILDAVDLVFVDPVSTGLSRSAQGEKPEQFYGVEEDVHALGEFVRLFTTREKRWSSTKYLCGESYGVLRVAGLADHLQQAYGWYPEGLVLLSGLVDFQTILAADANDLPYVLFLPTMTATAHYHGKLDATLSDLDRAVAESRAFALGDYSVALLKGNALEEGDRLRVARALSRFTGIPEKAVLSQNLRISPGFFRKALLSADGKVAGRFDGRVVAEDNEPGAQHPAGDPSYDNIAGAFASAINAYVRSELGYESDHPYHILKGLPWKYHQFEGRYVSTASSLRSAIQANPRLRTLVLCGRRDLAVPEDSMRYSVAHLRLAPALRQGIRFSLYESGHMMYLNEPDAEKLRVDLTGFLHGAR